jgi:hypothetical protein
MNLTFFQVIILYGSVHTKGIVQKNCCATMSVSFQYAVHEVTNSLNLKFVLNNEQLAAIEALCAKKHTFCLLPTGYGKSTISPLTPLIMDKVRQTCIILSGLITIHILTKCLMSISLNVIRPLPTILDRGGVLCMKLSNGEGVVVE